MINMRYFMASISKQCDTLQQGLNNYHDWATWAPCQQEYTLGSSIVHRQAVSSMLQVIHSAQSASADGASAVGAAQCAE